MEQNFTLPVADAVMERSFTLPTREELLAQGCPYGMTTDGDPFGSESTEWLRTNPDSVIYSSSNPHEAGNEMIGVIEVPSRDCLFAVWLQNTVEGEVDDRVMYSVSRDGKIWKPARRLVGCRPGMAGKDYMASCPYAMCADNGRIYVFYTQETEESRPLGRMTGLQMCVYSDDCGETWSEPVHVPRNQSPCDLPERGDIQSCFPCQQPIRLQDGRYLCAYTRFVSNEVFPWRPLDGCLVSDARTYFAIFENLHEGPDPQDLKFTWLPDDSAGVHITTQERPLTSAEEPFVVQLPNGWLFVSLRTFMGSVYYSVSEDLGHTWRDPKPMHYADGTLFVNPVVTPFLCDYGDGTYVQLYYGRCGTYKDMFRFRDTVYRAEGVFAPEDEQPIRFEKAPEVYVQVNVAVGSRRYIAPEVNLEASFTRFHGVPMLWYGDRKHYVLGKKL